MSVIDLSMSSPISSPPPSPNAGSSKRKAENGDDLASGKGKKAKANDFVEVKGRKVHFRQEPYQRALPRRRLLQVEGWLLDADEAGTTPTEIPDEFHDLVVMAGHELSSSSEAAFIKSLKTELVKGDSADLLKNDLLVPLVGKLFTLHQYGFQPSDFGVAPSRFPAGLQIRCWEANDIDKYFPVDRIPELKARRAERQQAREECERMLASMDDVEKAEFLKGEKTDKGDKPAKDAAKDTDEKPEAKEAEAPAAQPAAPAAPSPSKARTTRENSATSSRARSASPVKRGKKLTAEEEEEAKKRKEEKEAKKEEKRKEQEEKRKIQEEKRQQKQEEKAAKERDEQKKAQTKAKQTSMFTSFFKPAKAPQAQECEAGPSSAPAKKSPFENAFPPPDRRANVEIAPINQFSSTVSATARSSTDVTGWTRDDFLSDHLRRYQLSRQNPRRGRARGLKAEPRHGTVADKWLAYQEAEDPRAVLAELRDNTKFPWKTLAFDQQARPPYVGTFTKKSLAVGPRTPFAQDPVFDYSYDSGDDWQEEDEGGEDVDEPLEGEGDEDAVTEDEGEFDDWLDDAEDPLFSGGVDGDITMSDPTRTSPKKKIPVKRITKLNPTWQGPIWESVIAEPTEGMEDYRIQLLNDTPSSIDPFQYQSTEPLPQFKTTFSDTAVGHQLRVRCLLAAEATNAPKHPAVKAAPPNMPLGDASSSANKPAAKGRNPKVAFPQKHLPEFLRIVDGNTRILTDLISHLKIRFDKVTTKAAIEAKIREVATREGKGKDSPWKVKREAWDAAGVSPPAPTLGTIKTAVST